MRIQESALQDDEADALLRACADGDHRALRRLYDLWSSRLLGIALRITGQRALAEDATHDAFLQIWQQAGRFDATRGRAAAWMIGIVRFRAIDVMRRQQREVLGYEGEDRPDETPDQLDFLITASDGAALHHCLQQLEDDRRRLISLAFVEGLSHSSLAARLAMPLGTVKSMIRRSLTSLRGCLEA